LDPIPSFFISFLVLALQLFFPFYVFSLGSSVCLYVSLSFSLFIHFPRLITSRCFDAGNFFTPKQKPIQKDLLPKSVHFPLQNLLFEDNTELFGQGVLVILSHAIVFALLF
jgi:hypothetical protein